MFLSYRVGRPLWKAVARIGVPMSLRITIARDDECGVYIATSPDLDGLVVEAKSLNELRTEALAAAEMLMGLALHADHAPNTRTQFLLDDSALCAA